MNLVSDVLDKLLVDRRGYEIGRADGIVLDLRPGAAPRVSAVEIGPITLARRIHGLLGRIVEGLEHAAGLGSNRPVRIPFSAIVDFEIELVVEADAKGTGALALEHRLHALFGGRAPKTEKQSTRYAATPLEAGQRRLESLVGQPVVTGNRRRLGRLEEVRAERVRGSWVVTAYVLGSAGLVQRLGIGLIGAQPRGYVADWRQLDIMARSHLVINCPANELAEL